MRPPPLLAVLLLTSEVKAHLHNEVSFEIKVRDAREQRRQRWTRYSISAAKNRRSRGRRQDVPVDAAMLSNIVGSIADGTVVGPLNLPVGGNEPPVVDIQQGPPEIEIPAVVGAGTIGDLQAEEPEAELPLAEQPEEVSPEEELPEEELPEEELPEEELPEVGDDGPDGGLIGDLNDGILSPEGQNIADILLGNGKTTEENFEIGTRPGFDDHTDCDGKDPCCRWYYISKDLTAVFHNADGTCNSLARQSIRMGFHDAGTWSAKLAASGKNNGGADGSLVLFGELSRPENFGMEGAVDLASRLYHTYNVTMADLIQYMANHAVVSCPLGPRVRTYVGRKDATEAAPEGLLPSVHAPADELIALFADKTISAHELTALMGAHSTSTQSNVDASKAGYPQDTTPGVWDVNYYNETLDATENGCIFKLESDVKLSKHPAMAVEWQKFVGGQAHWNADYAKAYLRLSLLGVNNINELKECTLTLPAQQATAPKDSDLNVSGKCTASSSSSLISSSTITIPNTTNNPLSITEILNLNTTGIETLPSSAKGFSTLSEPLPLAPETSSVLLPGSTMSLEEAVPSSDIATPETTSLLLVSESLASSVVTTTVDGALETSLMSNSPISVTLASTGDAVSTTKEMPISVSEALASIYLGVTESQQQADGLSTILTYSSSLGAPQTITSLPIETSTMVSPSGLPETTTESDDSTPTSSELVTLSSSGSAIEPSSAATSHSSTEVAETSTAVSSASINESTLFNTIQDITISSPTTTHASSGSLVSNQITNSVSNQDLSTCSVPSSAASVPMGEPTGTFTDELSTPANDAPSVQAPQPSNDSISSPSDTSAYKSTSYEAAMPTETPISTQLLQAYQHFQKTLQLWHYRKDVCYYGRKIKLGCKDTHDLEDHKEKFEHAASSICLSSYRLHGNQDQRKGHESKHFY
ncbi:peroxidase [Parastagonospora nodorum]|nr:peroxidase [Parastagonospora nodorum]